MALTTIEYGSLASSATLNNNFNYLDGRITTTATSISSLNSQISTVNTNLTTNKANVDLSNVTDTVLTGKLSSTVLTNAGCLTSANISSAGSTTKAVIVNWCMPDYSSGTDITTSVKASGGYTCLKDGWIISKVESEGSYNVAVKVNGASVSSVSWIRTADWSGIAYRFEAPVSKNDVITCDNNPNYLLEVIFYPCKGE